MTSHPVAVVPAHNEEMTIGRVVGELRARGFEVCVVDDGSTDSTACRAAAKGAVVLGLPANVGVGGALRCGFRWAVAKGADAVVQVDGDGQHPPAEAGRLLAEAEILGCDMLVGSRFHPDSPGYRAGFVKRLAIRVLSLRVKRISGVEVTDPTSGFRVIRGPLVGLFARSYPNDYLADTVEALMIAGMAGYTVAEVPVAMRERSKGKAHAGSTRSAVLLAELLLVSLLKGRRLSID